MTDTATAPAVHIPHAPLDVCGLARAGSTLTVREVALLAEIAARHGLSVKHYATALNVQKPVVTRAMARLERDGLARRHIVTTDRRMAAFHATAAGRKMLAHFGGAA